jgi:hypothetical protein
MPQPDTSQNPADYGRVRQPYQGADSQPAPDAAPAPEPAPAKVKPAKSATTAQEG